MSSILRRSRRALRVSNPKADDGVAMVLAMMVILVVGTLTIGIAGITLAQMKPTELLQKNVQTIHGAEAGIDAGLGRVRAATIAGLGVSSLLPCNSLAVGTAKMALTGAAAEGVGGASYQVSIRYYPLLDPADATQTGNPADKSAAWRTTNAIPCTGLTGPSAVPSFALIESTGTISTGRTASQGNRSLESVYSFSRELNNVVGGFLRVYSTAAYCAVASAPTVGASISMQLCTNPLLSKNLTQWAYLGTGKVSSTGQAYPLALALVSTLSTTQPLCLTVANSKNQDASLQPCGTDSATKLTQQWSYNDSGQFEGPNSNGKTDGYCIVPSLSPVAVGAKVTQTKCSSNTIDWIPDASVGAGQAGSTTGLPDVANGQLVNFKEFGRCFDITASNINSSYIIDYPCKQAPDPTQVKWNQRESWDWDFTTNTGTRTVKPTGSGAPANYCLAASTTGPSTTELYAVFKPCTGLADQQWVFTGLVQGNYAGSYLVKNVGTSKCLGLGSPNGGTPDWSTITVEKCDGTDMAQKWNAPAGGLGAGRANTRENTVGS